jgi:hypothetical protein
LPAGASVEPEAAPTGMASPVTTALEPPALPATAAIPPPAHLSPAEIASAAARVVRARREPTPAARVLLDEKEAVADAWIRGVGYDGARARARKTTRAFMALARLAEARRDGAAVADARASAAYWRDVSDLIVVAAATR